MASIIAKELIDSQQVSRSADGYQVQTKWHITGITGAPAEKVYKAIVLPGVPQMGFLHPYVPGVIVTGVTGSAKDTGNVVLTITYSTPQASSSGGSNNPANDDKQPVLTVSSSLVSVITNKDFKGNDITLEHTFEREDDAGGIVEETVEQIAEIEYLLPVIKMSFSRKETSDPFNKAAKYLGKINLSNFQGQPRHTVLCTNLSGQSNDDGETYQVDYEFQIGTWNPTVIFKDDNGTPVENPVKGKGIKEVQIYQEANFNDLRL